MLLFVCCIGLWCAAVVPEPAFPCCVAGIGGNLERSWSPWGSAAVRWVLSEVQAKLVTSPFPSISFPVPDSLHKQHIFSLYMFLWTNLCIGFLVYYLLHIEVNFHVWIFPLQFQSHHCLALLFHYNLYYILCQDPVGCITQLSVSVMLQDWTEGGAPAIREPGRW